MGNLYLTHSKCLCAFKLNTFVGSYNTRRATAVSHLNIGPDNMRTFNKTASKQIPGKFTKLYMQKKLKEKMHSRKRKQRKFIFRLSTKLIFFFKIIMYIFKFICIYDS